ncbi:hypothetical protein CC78DRAFT_578856 [Lojkania enalia]|uniref:Uncharacterized protein n=1 Tax=Lojkania enalia TaxID=147567 RepID=A0A9P4KC90_9PLEO|nr:hypothetical protein CC78DRAFT_578856 [Didymosphaeria enalia]
MGAFAHIGPVFGKSAPSKNLKFPRNANMTAAEILCFFPYWLKSADVVYRLVANGMTSKNCTIMINAFRAFEPGPTTSNGIYHMLKDTMRGFGHKDWTVTKHQEIVPEDWTHNVIAVGGFRTHAEDFPKRSHHSPLVPSVPFADLGVDVKMFPDGDDALDVTRCIKYAVEHPDEKWNFPTDYAMLLEKVGGAKKVEQEHWDGSVFNRWNGVKGYHTKPDDKFKAKGRRLKKKRKTEEEQAGETEIIEQAPARKKKKTGCRKSTPADNTKYEKISDKENLLPVRFGTTETVAPDQGSGSLWSPPHFLPLSLDLGHLPAHSSEHGKACYKENILPSYAGATDIMDPNQGVSGAWSPSHLFPSPLDSNHSTASETPIPHSTGLVKGNPDQNAGSSWPPYHISPSQFDLDHSTIPENSIPYSGDLFEGNSNLQGASSLWPSSCIIPFPLDWERSAILDNSLTYPTGFVQGNSDQGDNCLSSSPHPLPPQVDLHPPPFSGTGSTPSTAFFEEAFASMPPSTPGMQAPVDPSGEAQLDNGPYYQGLNPYNLMYPY